MVPRLDSRQREREEEEREINNGRKIGWRATSHVRALKSPALSRFLVYPFWINKYVHVGISDTFKGIQATIFLWSARFNDFFCQGRWLFVWEEIIYT